MKNIIIIGAGGVGKETASLIEDINEEKPQWNLLGFVDDDKSLKGKCINGYDVLGEIEYLNKLEDEFFAICTISNPIIKCRVLEKLNNPVMRYANLIHPTAVISKHVAMGEGVIIQAYCVITTNVSIKNHVQLNPQCGIGHDSTIGEYASLYWNVNISGHVKVGTGCLLGTKATVFQGLKVGDWSIIGANSTVLKDLPSYCTAAGAPARIIKYHREV